MNSRKVRDSCFLVCLSVLLGSSYSVPASAATPKNPSGFTATAGARGDVILRWNPVPNAISYSLQGPGVPVDSKTGMPPNISGTTYTVKGLPAGTYSWVLFAVYSGPSGPYSGDGSNPARTSLTVTGPASAATPKNPPVTASPAVTTTPQAPQSPQKARNPTPSSPITSQLPSPMKTAPGITPAPAKSGVPAIATWAVLWGDVWKKTNAVFRIGAGPTVMRERACQGNLGLGTLIENYVRAIQLKKYGDAVRWMAQFQDRSLCLTPEGVRGVEFALSAFVHQAITRLPPNETQTAVQGAFNLGTITFDQIQYTGRSFWLPMVYYHNQKIRSLMSTYPRNELGFWVYDFNGGNLVRPGSPDTLDRLLIAMQRFDNFGRGTCNLLDMSQAGFTCRDTVPTKGGSSTSVAKGGQGGGVAGPGSGSSQVIAGCIVNAGRSSGGRGMLACAGKAMAGLRPSVNDRPTDPGASIVDKSCALRDETGGDPADPEAEGKKPTKWERIKDAAGTAYDAGNSDTVGGVLKTGKDITVSVFMAVFDLTPPGIGELMQLAGPAGADLERGGMQAIEAKQALTKFDGTDPETGIYEYFRARESRVSTDPTANKDQRTVSGDGEPRGGGCSKNASNAARRAQALYDCYQGDGPATAGGGSPKPGVIDPTIALTTEPQTSGLATGMMDCLTQGGSLVRVSANDPRCLKAKCVQGEPCSCDPGGGSGSQAGVEGGGQASAPRAGPDCIDGPCGPGIKPPGGGVPPGAPPGGGPRPPISSSTAPMPPPQGATGTVSPPTTLVPATQRTIPASPLTTLVPATQGTIPVSPPSTLVPATRGIGTAPQLQQRGTIGSVPPLP